MSEYFIHLVDDIIVALEHNSVELGDNNEAMRSLLRRIESGEISGADAQWQKSHLMSVSDRLQEERLTLVSAAKDVRVRARRRHSYEFLPRDRAERVQPGRTGQPPS
jgi:hypothetical protein